MTELDRLVWAVSRSYDIEGTRFAIRCTSEPFGLKLDEALQRYRHEGEAPYRYSIVMAEENGRTKAKERYHILYRGTIALVRTTDPGVLVRMLMGDLETASMMERGDAMYADMVPVHVDGVTALVPEVLVPFLGTLGNRRVARAGLHLPMETAVAIDPDDGRIHPVTPTVQTDEALLEGSDGHAEAAAAAGRSILERPTPVDVLISIGYVEETMRPVSRGLALYRLASHVTNLWAFGERGLLALRHLVEGARCYELGSKKPPEMLQGLLATFSQS